MLGAVALGETRISGLLEGEDVLHTAAALRLLGAEIVRRDGGDGAEGGGTWHIHGVGIGGFSEPADILDMGNSGTSARLLTGLLATSPFTSFMTGDASLRRRPMNRVIEPLSRVGAQFLTRAGGRLPMAVTGASLPIPIRYVTPVPSAQVKSAVLLAALNTPGDTTVIEREATRDHSEIMLAHFGAAVKRQRSEEGTVITVTGQPTLNGCDIVVPADPSSAAFAVVAACLVPGASLIVENVGLNPLRAGLFATLEEMGARIERRNERQVGGEIVADLLVRGGELQGVDVPPERAPSMIDEYPILAVAAACARGTTTMRGLAELRVKESDRLAAIANGLQANGVKFDIAGDTLAVHGAGDARGGGMVPGGGLVATHLDHRIAMSFLVLGMRARDGVAVDDVAMIDTSFPGFVALMNSLGAKIAPVQP